MTTNPGIRTRTLQDVDRLAWVHLTCWQQAYAGIVSQELLDSFTLEERVRAWTRILATAQGNRFVAEVGGEIVGFSAAGPGQGDNRRARAFYARNGFNPDGATRPYERWEDMPEIRMVR